MEQSKKRSLNKLSLNKEKVTTLSQENLANIVGGDSIDPVGGDTSVGIADSRILCFASKSPGCTTHSSVCDKKSEGGVLLCTRF